MRVSLLAAAFAALLCCSFAHPSAVRADDAGPPAALDKWTAGKEPQLGLFPIWRDGGKVYMEISTAQLGKDFIEQGIPASGLGGWNITEGNPYFDVARIIRFARADNKISITWPNTSFTAPQGSPEAKAVQQTFAPSVVALAPIVAEDNVTGRIIFDASPLLGDVSDFTDAINQTIGITDPQAQYHIDPDRSYFGRTKAFADNDLIEVDQTFNSQQPPVDVDNVPDPRSVQIAIDYNFIEAPALGSYTPRIADERVGFYPVILLQFGNDRVDGRQARYIMRWNFAPANPRRPSPATNPMVWYLSNTIPARYHDTVRDALLQWNKAFAKAGILNAVQVRDQPDDPAWDPNDIRYNVVRWLTESNGGGFAQAGSVWDPRTGQLLHVGIVIDSDIMRYTYLDWRDYANPSAAGAFSGPARGEAAFAENERAQLAFGNVALSAMGLLRTATERNRFDTDGLRMIVMHEAGHEMGLEHNFIGSTAYTARELQDKAFTARYGIASSVMEYLPLNAWPKGTRQADYFMPTVGQYDYYAIHWGYAAIPSARTPEDEVPTLKRWASSWSLPEHRFSMDEDVSYSDAHAIDPRVSWNDLTDDNLGWCETQLHMSANLLRSIGNRYPGAGEAFDSARSAFGTLLYHYRGCTDIAEHYIAGEQVNRSHVGDAGFNGVPLSAVSRVQEQRAFGILDRYLFSDSAWNYPPQLLRRLVYTEWVTDFPQPAWAYQTQPRHDLPIAEIASGIQGATLQTMFSPLMLQRLDDLSLKYKAGETMSLADLFTWMQSSAFGDLRAGGPIHEIHRNLQQQYARLLARLVLRPLPGTPYDAQSLARAELKSLQVDLRRAASSSRLDTISRAHVDSLLDLVTQALEAKRVVSS